MIKRIISRLDIKNNFLVKGINLEGLRVLGSPEVFANIYYNENIDELILQDVVASLYKRNQLNELTKKISQNIFIPITVGGGIRSIDDISKALDSGADRVSINSAAVENPKFIEEAIKKFGSSTISLSIETLNVDSEYKIYTESGRKETNINFFDWIKRAEDYQVGELIITSIKSEGRSKGLDLDLYKRISDIVTIPVLAHGGASGEEDILNLFKETIIQGIVICSAFHFHYLDHIKPDSKLSNQGSTNFVNNLKNYKNFKTPISTLKKFLRQKNIDIND